MRLFCQKALLLLLCLTVACHESTAPPIPVPAYFVLKAINGRQLPTLFSFGSNIIIVSASLGLDGTGKATMTELRRESVQGVPNETLHTSIFNYRIQGDQIEIGCLENGPDIRLCPEIIKGTITNGVLSLTVVQVSIDGSIVYEYQQMGAD
jgi:hypothetical protein